MKVRFPSLAIVMVATASIAAAERNLIPTLEREFDVCADRPLEPEWMQSMDQRESHKRLLIQQIYRAQSMERIVTAQDCECETRFPTWEAAQQLYFELYADEEYWPTNSATSEFRREANRLRTQAMPICEQAGNW